MKLQHLPRWAYLGLALAMMLSGLGASAQDATPTHETLFKHMLTALAPIELAEHNLLHRPIELADDKVHWIDRTYAYGYRHVDTQQVHLGVEFVNERNTAVYAAKAGRVVFAGDDAATLLGPKLGYYGNAVILAHNLFSLAGRRLYTLYGHLETIDVEAGQYVEDQARLGRVGATGIALGPHLHFEVRVSDPYDYRQTRNPDLWLQHYREHGMIVGSVRNQAGEALESQVLLLRSSSNSRDVLTYGGDEVNSDPVWRENFTAGDLLEGSYDIFVLDEHNAPLHRESVQVEAYRTTVVDIVLPAD